MYRDRLYQLGSLLALLVAWELAVGVLGVVSPSVLPTPAVVAATVVQSLGTGRFQTHLATTLWRTVVAAGLASVCGVTVGLAMGWNRNVNAALSPLFAALFPLPAITLFPLLILLLGSDERALVFTAALGAFFLVLWNSANGVRNIDAVYFEVASDNGVGSSYALFREVLLPGSLPLVLVGLRLGLSTSLLIVIAVEFVAGDRGLGYVLWVSWTSYQLPVMYATLVVVGAVGALITYGLAFLSHRLLPWKPDVRGELLV
jgi:NitT/TauT family transport system permease protein